MKITPVANYPKYQNVVHKTLPSFCKKEEYPQDIKAFINNGRLDKQAQLKVGLKLASKNQDILSDIKKIKIAQKTGKSIREIFVPNFKNKEDAIKNLKIGDVCHIGQNKFISIKSKENEIENLSLSKGKYLELFPPVERFCALQNHIGDCWLVAACDTMYSNPHTRYRFLSVFKENESGGIDINFDGFKIQNGKSTPINKESTTYRNTHKQQALRVKSPKGFGCIEEAVERKYEIEGQEKIIDFYNKAKKAKEIDGFYTIDGLEYDREEIETFIKETEPYLKSPKVLSLIYLAPSVKEVGIIAYKEDIDDYLDYLNSDYVIKNFTEKEIKAIRKMLIRYRKKTEENPKMPVKIDGIIPPSVHLKFERLNSELNYSSSVMYNELRTPYIISGNPKDLFELFNLTTDYEWKPIDENKFENPNPNWIMAGFRDSEKYKGFGYSIYPNHAYSISIRDSKSKKPYVVRNPQNTSREVTLSKGELLKAFSNIVVGFE